MNKNFLIKNGNLLNAEPYQNMNFLNFFLFLWGIFALLDPDPADQNQFGSESKTPVVRINYGAGVDESRGRFLEQPSSSCQNHLFHRPGEAAFEFVVHGTP
jgi:hypothetical protein